MSSHHFVKEGQEPAIFILEGVSFERVEQLLEWAPLVMVAERAVEAVLQWGIKMDVIFRHEYEFNDLDALAKDQFPVQILSCTKNNLIKDGLTFLIQRNHAGVNIISTQTEEIFHVVAQLGLPIQIGVYTENCKWSLVSSGKFEKWMPEGSQVRIRNERNATLHTEGIFQTGDLWTIENTGMMRILSNSPFWIGEPFF